MHTCTGSEHSSTQYSGNNGVLNVFGTFFSINFILTVENLYNRLYSIVLFQ